MTNLVPIGGKPLNPCAFIWGSKSSRLRSSQFKVNTSVGQWPVHLCTFSLEAGWDSLGRQMLHEWVRGQCWVKEESEAKWRMRKVNRVTVMTEESRVALLSTARWHRVRSQGFFPREATCLVLFIKVTEPWVWVWVNQKSPGWNSALALLFSDVGQNIVSPDPNFLICKIIIIPTFYWYCGY